MASNVYVCMYDTSPIESLNGQFRILENSASQESWLTRSGAELV